MGKTKHHRRSPVVQGQGRPHGHDPEAGAAPPPAPHLPPRLLLRSHTISEVGIDRGGSESTS